LPDLKPFQKATVKAALKALTRKGGTYRFLVADEVGLGKTLVAGDVIRRMAKLKDGPFVVLYVCSNLSIAAQNKKKLLEWLPVEERKIAVSRVDRLTLLPENNMRSEARVHLYTLTPDTSIPMRGNRRRDGKKEERALIHALVKKIWPEFFNGRNPAYFRGSVGSRGWRELVKKKRKMVGTRQNRQLRETFRLSVRKELELEDGMHVTAALDSIEAEKKDLEIIARFRNALAAMAIEKICPDLVIFDEFQQFRDLLEEDIDDSAARVIKALRGEIGEHQPKLLLLSATPYRPYTRHWEDEKYGKDNSHRREFFDLLEFLYRRTAKAKRISAMCADALLSMEMELRKGDLSSDRFEQARKSMEKSLRSVICRTERVLHTSERLGMATSTLPSNIEAADLKVFKHMARSFQTRHQSAAPSYWNSIPLPMQTMGPSYQTWKEAQTYKDRTVPSFRKRQRDQFKKSNPAHPRLRALKSILPVERLALPWIAPSAPWWPLKGLWGIPNGDSGKVLIFSRFRAVPQAVASLMSYDLEAHLLSTDSIEYEEMTKRRSLQPKAGNEALLGHFYPSVFLMKNTDPIAGGCGSIRIAKKSVEQQLRRALKNIGIRVREGNRKRPTWMLISALERKQLGSWDAINYVVKRWERLHVTGTIAKRDGSETGFRKMLKAWSEASDCDVTQISPLEFKDLTRYALSAPGVVVGRALARHWKEALETEGLIKCIEVSWKGLRNYLSSRLFVKALSGSDKRYPEAIRKAAFEGNLESVLDEHLWISSKLGGAVGAELADELLEALRVRTSNFFLHALGNKGKRGRFSLRCHAAMPFTDPRADKASIQPFGYGERPIRTDELRKAFNTPFWPHVLATTSIGQEGLDFHVWCETLLHWDLCNNPVDIEQREGRISRYGGLAIRKRLSQLLWHKGMQPPPFKSTWEKIEKIAERKYADKAGLAPWWVCQGADIKRLTIDLPASEQRHRLEVLRQQRLLYRLALGQPNQDDLLEVLRAKFGENKNVGNIGLNLSAFFMKP